MIQKILELNDLGISIADQSGVLASSPGYAVALGRGAAGLQFGERAAAQSRLHPVNSSNDFWYRLGTEPLARPIAHCRSNAELAYSQLMELAQAAQLDNEELIVALPGSFSRPQLAVLLGLLRQTPMRAVGLVDSALLAAAGQPQGESIVYLELQLHQIVLTRLQLRSGEVQRSALVQVPGLGWATLAQTLVQLITDAFIQQCRFNPLHNAQWEQYMHDNLAGWLGQKLEDDNTLRLEIDTGSVRHQAKLTRAGLVTRLQHYYHKLMQHLQDLQTAQEQPASLLLSPRTSTLPGLRAALQAAGWQSQLIVPREEIARTALRYQDQLLSQDAQALSFVTRLRLSHDSAVDESGANASSAAGTRAEGAAQLPTHVLLEHQAWPLGQQLSISLAGEERLQLQGQGRLLAHLERRQGEVVLQALQPGWSVNGAAPQPAQLLQNGDVLSFAGAAAQPLQLIQVRHVP